MLPDAQSRGAARGHALRAAINTPIQGSAADIANAAMLSIARQQQLQDMGWRLLLQVRTCQNCAFMFVCITPWMDVGGASLMLISSALAAWPPRCAHHG